ncbi:MAG: DUF268 domain-containing protein [Methylacidiphilales bacterium]|nr:DUF268 domain-containing protein [Candidatus Methylacidiphilales bacterium]
MLRKILTRLTHLGFNTRKFRVSLRNWGGFRRDLREFKRQQAVSSIVFANGPLYPCLADKEESGGTAKGHYFHLDLLIARKIYQRKPRRHLDVGSRIDGFVAHVAAFREIEIIDIRPLEKGVTHIKVQCADLTGDLPPELIGCCDSLSCLHALEHFGLGRYGDPIKYTGYLDGLINIHHILEPGGKFYFGTPMGPQRVEFNAHRVFSARYLWELLMPSYRIDTFSFVDDAGDLHEDIDLKTPDLQKKIDDNFGCDHGCGIFELTRR